VVYRIHFTVQDIARTAMGHPAPLGELGAAVRVLRSTSHPVRLGAWRRDALARLDPRARMVFDLIPVRGVAPTFLTASGGGSPAALLEGMRATPRRQIRDDLAHVAEWRPPPPWTRHLADDPRLLQQLCDSVAHVFDVLLAPHWAHVVSEATADHGRRWRQMLTGGVESLLTTLNPRHVAWRPPVLEVSLLAGIDGDLHLDGRGLLLVPMVFGGEAPAIDIDAEPQPVLRYPILRDQPSDARPLFASPARPPSPGVRSPLASLLGPTRAAVLHAIAEHSGCSTKELASHVGITPSSASEHAATLRRAGLVRTGRHRNTAIHTPTALGIGLLNTTS
jgi:DNA-binding transcriptional ArsR family regulator